MNSDDRTLHINIIQTCRLLNIYGSMEEIDNKYYSFSHIMDRDGLQRSDEYMSKLFYLTSIKRITHPLHR